MSPFESSVNDAGAIPTTVWSTPLSVRLRPTIDGSPPKRRFQSPSLIIATRALPGDPRLRGTIAPSTGLMPSNGKSDGVSVPPPNCSGSPCPVN